MQQKGTFRFIWNGFLMHVYWDLYVIEYVRWAQVILFATFAMDNMPATQVALC